MTIKLNVDSIGYPEKPTQYYGVIRVRLCNKDSIKEIDPEELIRAVKQGRAFTPAAMTGTTGDTWQSQQVICADIDNDTEKKDAAGNKVRIDNPLTPDEAREIMSRYGISPYFIYWSYSSKPDFPRYRIVLILDAPLTDPAEAEDLTARFIGLFNRERPGCTDTVKDNARMFLGSKPDCIEYRSGKLTPVSLLRKLPAPPEDPRKVAQKAREQQQPPKEYNHTPEPYTGVYRSQSVLDYMFEYDKVNFPLADYIEQTTGSQPHRSGKALYYNPCPICGHNDDFQVTGGLWHCFNTNSTEPGAGKGGAVIDLLYYHDFKGTCYPPQTDKAVFPLAMDKFKFDIMKYNRDEWTAAWRAENAADQSSTHTNLQEQQPAPSASSDGSATADSSEQSEPLTGLLTPERAIATLEAVDDDYIELPHFPQLSGTLKLKRHDTVVIAADTGAGKSSLSLNFLYDLQDRYPAIYVNLENDAATVLQRLISIHTGLELDRIEGYKRDITTRAAVNEAIREITERQPIQFLEDIYNLKEIEAKIQAATKDRTAPTLVFIDTGLLVTLPSKTASRYERFTQISEELRRISRLNNIVMFVLLQQNREGKKEEQQPTNSSLKESGSWENDATKILFLWNNPLTQGKEIVITKNRSGESGVKIPLNYYPHTQTYREATGGKSDRFTNAIRL